MLLVKIWGSLIAPKNKVWLNEEYLKDISSFFWKFNKIFIAHGTWNIGHWRVSDLIKKNPWKNLKDLLVEDYENWRKILDNYFSKIDYYFAWYKRISINEFLESNKCKYSNLKFIIWGDVTKDGRIISSDDIISEMVKCDSVDLILILTDVDGVFDKNWNVINEITKYNFDKINFWKKENDVTWGMKQKVLKLLNLWKKVVICNWNNFENIKSWINNWIWRWTIIY